jgi:threonine dehydrogenase-like Zn-dependent dehydrogenase
MPAPAGGEALIRVRMAGICNTDIELLRGYMNYRGIIGHEFVGVVEKSPDPSLLGKRVVGEINCACGECRECRSGHPRHCTSRTVLGIAGRGGAFAEYVALPIQNLHLVPDAVTDEQAVFTEPLAAACRIPEQLHVNPSTDIVVLGDGKLGLLVAQVLSLTGAGVTVVGRHHHKLAIMKSMGIRVRDAGEISDLNVDVVVECTGRPAGLQAAISIVRPCGTIVMKSTYFGELVFPQSELVVDEVSLVGSRCGPFEPALHLLERKAVDAGVLIEAIYPLEEGLRAFERAESPESLKVLLSLE